MTGVAAVHCRAGAGISQGRRRYSNRKKGEAAHLLGAATAHLLGGSSGAQQGWWRHTAGAGVSHGRWHYSKRKKKAAAHLPGATAVHGKSRGHRSRVRGDGRSDSCGQRRTGAPGKRTQDRGSREGDAREGGSGKKGYQGERESAKNRSA